MKKAVLIPDSFKGTLTSQQICDILRQEIQTHFPDCETVSIPVADGGEGSVDCFLSVLGGEKVFKTVKNPYFEDMTAFYGLIENGQTAIVEMAACAGLPLVEDRKNPLKTTTYGVGQLILAAASRGVKKIIVGLGGSATNDGGCGAAAAAGIRFFNAAGESFIPTGGTTGDIFSIDFSGRDAVLDGVEIVTMCDIDNPMYGPAGAAHVFGPQKGADPEMVQLLDSGIRNLCEVIRRDSGQDLRETPGGGAAGAMGAGMIAFFGSRLQMGIQTVLDTVNFDAVLAGADMVFTGEGKLDSQSLRGKVVAGVAGRAKAQGVPVTVLVGGAEDPAISAVYEMGVTSVFPINRLPQDFSVSRKHSADNLAYTMDNILRLLAHRP
ncbi:MAG: glycerate kinase [Oscillibacter sp.]|nr:glycerate kinase [Oscillibacter sp.]MCI9375327.1 glycerate kinase [Oscillibacter sp.]